MKKWLNNYHKDVFKNLKNFMNKLEIVELQKKHVQLSKILFQSSSKRILIFNFFCLINFSFVGFNSPTTRKSSFFEIEPRTLPPLFSAIVLLLTYSCFQIHR